DVILIACHGVLGLGLGTYGATATHGISFLGLKWGLLGLSALSTESFPLNKTYFSVRPKFVAPDTVSVSPVPASIGRSPAKFVAVPAMASLHAAPISRDGATIFPCAARISATAGVISRPVPFIR